MKARLITFLTSQVPRKRKKLERHSTAFPNIRRFTTKLKLDLELFYPRVKQREKIDFLIEVLFVPPIARLKCNTAGALLQKDVLL